MVRVLQTPPQSVWGNGVWEKRGKKRGRGEGKGAGEGMRED